jgi:hypothetical protein
MLLVALFADETVTEQRGTLFLACGLDIARGGSGQIEPNPGGAALTD